MYLLPIANAGVELPRIDYFYPGGMVNITPGDTIEIISLIVGTRPLSVTWQHNGSRVVNQTTPNNTHFLLTEVIHTGMMLSKLTITNVGEGVQGSSHQQRWTSRV